MITISSTCSSIFFTHLLLFFLFLLGKIKVYVSISSGVLFPILTCSLFCLVVIGNILTTKCSSQNLQKNRTGLDCTVLLLYFKLF